MLSRRTAVLLPSPSREKYKYMVDESKGTSPVESSEHDGCRHLVGINESEGLGHGDENLSLDRRRRAALTEPLGDGHLGYNKRKRMHVHSVCDLGATPNKGVCVCVCMCVCVFLCIHLRGSLPPRDTFLPCISQTCFHM